MRALLAAMALTGMFTTTQAVADSPVVVELYTSQGCSSCPPADAFLHELAKRDDVIALALHVDYWDYIGWKDSFATPEYTARQHAYAQSFNAAVVYTPQMVINGKEHVVGSRTVQVMDGIMRHQAAASSVDVSVTRSGGAVEISADADEEGDYLVQLVRYTPQETIAIRRGENAGRELSYANVVRKWDVVGRWDGSSALNLRAAAEGDEPVVVLIQQAGHGAIVGAAQLR
ncbi:DUF1223 domain-containing protein [Yoonia sp. 2307UL14-13]|uniref:DUF1223 domain-containing protein n=1 Tax=Yoonia sp. 2307UL14-13 TaxID=3126506 RepID=UPI0030B509A7